MCNSSLFLFKLELVQAAARCAAEVERTRPGEVAPWQALHRRPAVLSHSTRCLRPTGCRRPEHAAPRRLVPAGRRLRRSSDDYHEVLTKFRKNGWREFGV